jgi:multidrug efflux pump subunit AcrA (membrane-fusion protein)
MKRTILIALIIILIFAAGGAVWWTYRTAPDRVRQLLARLEVLPPADSGRLLASGDMEASKVRVTTESGGRIVELLADEGDTVEAGQLLVRLDSALLEAQIEQAEALVEVADAALAVVMAQARPEELRQAQAVVAQAEASREAARQAWLDAQRLRDNPQDLEVQIVAARSEVEVAEHRWAAARANAQAADLELQFWERTMELLRQGADISMPIPGGSTISVHIDSTSDKLKAGNLQWNLASQSAWQAHEAEREAEETLQAAQQALSHLLEQRDDPQQLQAQVDNAKAAFRAAGAAVQAAAAGLQAVQDGASEEQIGLAEAECAAAQAALDALLARRDNLLLSAPRRGLVVTCPVHAGELALPGSVLLEIANLEEMTLTVYVPERRLSEVQLGQTVWVSVDSFPDRLFAGEVIRIGDEAEFTPLAAAMEEDQVLLVFAVEIALANADKALKPGLPADALFPEPEAG